MGFKIYYNYRADFGIMSDIDEFCREHRPGRTN